MVDLKVLTSVQQFSTAVQRALAKNEAGSSEELDQLVDSLTAQVNQTVEALDRPGDTPIGEDPFDYYTALINGLTADIAALRQSDAVSSDRVEGLADTLSDLGSRFDDLPSGAIIESGSNANGRYIRFADGTQICTHQEAVLMSLSVQYSAYQYYTTYGWVFPATFIDGTRFATASARIIGRINSVTPADNGGSDASMKTAFSAFFSDVSIMSGTMYIRWYAIGRWR